MGVRRVVTGQTSDGKAFFRSDQPIEPLRLYPGSEFFDVWAGDAVAAVPNDGAEPVSTSYWPPPGGFRFLVFTLHPGNGASAERPLHELDEVRPHWADMRGAEEEEDEPGMHTSATVDFGIVLSGEICLELDDGAERVLRAGDTVVQNGTRHRWANRGEVPATVAFVLLGAPP
jgi:hypothetical protein